VGLKYPLFITFSAYLVLFVLHVSTDSQSPIQAKDVTKKCSLTMLYLFHEICVGVEFRSLGGETGGKETTGET